jgi:hypothetical protein
MNGFGLNLSDNRTDIGGRCQGKGLEYAFREFAKPKRHTNPGPNMQTMYSKDHILYVYTNPVILLVSIVNNDGR